ncbi:hypothetical protein [Candidatus Palauibacter sp.]
MTMPPNGWRRYRDAVWRAGEISVPPDFDRMGSGEIASLFDAAP